MSLANDDPLSKLDDPLSKLHMWPQVPAGPRPAIYEFISRYTDRLELIFRRILLAAALVRRMANA